MTHSRHGLRRRLARLLILGLTIMSAGTLRAQDAPADAEQAERDALLKFLTERAGTYSLTDAEGGEEFERTPKPVLHYTALSRDYLKGGAMFLWLDGARPVAAGSLWLHDDGKSRREFTSLVDEPFICRNEQEQPVWTPKGGSGVQGIFPDAPAPTASNALRLAQMRNLARRFSATFYRQADGESFRLRLMPQPVYRYASLDDGVLDAALFVLAESNDPDLLLTITARTEPADNGSRWSYALARMCSMKLDVWLDDRELDTFPYYWRNPRSPEDPYIEANDGQFEPSNN